MKPELDKEIDSLLRRNARLAAAGPKSAGAAAATARESSHLDADELNAFAEGALPAAARSRYASHLADCDECRVVVVRLSGAAAAGELEKRAAVPIAAAKAPWWRSLLGAVFAPGALRYATPVLILSLVGVVSFIALRSRQGSVPVTVYTPAEGVFTGAESSSPANTGAATSGAVSPATETPPGQGAAAGRMAEPATVKSGDARTAHPAETGTGDKDAARADSSESPFMAKGPGAAGGGAKAKESGEEKADAAASPPAPAAAPAKAADALTTEPRKGEREDLTRNRAAEAQQDYAVNESGRQVEQNRAGQFRQKQEIQMPDDSSRNESRATNTRGNVAGLSAPSPRTQRSAAKRGGSDDKTRDAEEDEVTRVDARSVAGHRFRREGSVWVDVQYKSSMSMTGVRRGSDAYRALVADVPQLGRIAEQLGGEIIVVIKGRAYRIR